MASVQLKGRSGSGQKYYVASYMEGRERERRVLVLSANRAMLPNDARTKEAVMFGRVSLTGVPDQIALYSQCAGAAPKLLKRQEVSWPEVEAAVQARAEQRVNPVDLGAILVPNDWLVLTAGQTAIVDFAALSRKADLLDAQLSVGFDDERPTTIQARLVDGKRLERQFTVTAPFTQHDRAVLHVRLKSGERTLWQKDLDTMLVSKTPQWPRFGAVETKLRYDAPISVRDPKSGASLPSLDYNQAWDKALKDVVIFLPNGSRLVFWRGAAFVPMWAGRYNTGFSSAWAATLSPLVGEVDGAEAINDKELRYSRVTIVESTPTRIHVRWVYQPTDFVYHAWGDGVAEDYYFYPDGFGTRVMTLVSLPDVRYQLTQFLVITPQAAYPFEVLPKHAVDIVYLDGAKTSLTFPSPFPDRDDRMSNFATVWKNPPQKPALYRVFLHKDDPATAVYFSPDNIPPELTALEPMYDQGVPISLGYWGAHWPLTRGLMTEYSLAGHLDRVDRSPAHNVVMDLGGPAKGFSDEGQALSSSEHPTVDALGKSRNMLTRTWVWLMA